MWIKSSFIESSFLNTDTHTTISDLCFVNIIIVKVIVRTFMNDWVEAFGESTFRSSCSSSLQRASKPASQRSFQPNLIGTNLTTTSKEIQMAAQSFKFKVLEKYISRCSSCRASHHTRCPWGGADSKNSFKTQKNSYAVSSGQCHNSHPIRIYLYEN